MLGDKKPVVMASDRAIPGGVATLGDDGKLLEAQRPETTVAGVTGLEAALAEKAAKAVPAEAGNVATLDGDGNLQDSGVNLDSKQDTLTGTQGQVVGFDEEGNAVAQDMPADAEDITYKEGTLADALEAGLALTGTGAPGEQTKGAVGQRYTDTAGSKSYVCTKAAEGAYEWQELAGGMRPQVVVTTAAEATVTADCEGQTQQSGQAGEDGTVTFDLPAFGTWKFKATKGADSAEGTVAVEQVQRYTLELSFVKIYGVTWDGTPTQEWSRTDASAQFEDPVPKVGSSSPSSPFDQLMPWAGMVESDHPQAGRVVAIPKFWYKLEEYGSGGLSLKIADKQTEGFHVSPAHMDRDGSGERDVVYIGKYHCAENTYKSTTGVKPQVNVTCPDFRTRIAALTTGQDKIVMCDEATYYSLFFLYLVEFAHWDTQKKIGYGCSNSQSAVFTMGTTDTLGYHTGADGAAIDTGGETKYRNITGLWDNCYDWVGGVRNATEGVYIELDPSKWADTTGGKLAGLPSSGFPLKFKVTTDAGFPLFIPTEENGGKDKVSGDGWGFSASSPCVFRGGGYGRNDNYGLFYRNYDSVSYSSGNRGSRLLVLP